MQLIMLDRKHSTLMKILPVWQTFGKALKLESINVK